MDVERAGGTRLFDLPDGWDYRLTDGGVLAAILNTRPGFMIMPGRERIARFVPRLFR